MKHLTTFPTADMPLKDIRDVAVDSGFPKEEWIAEFVHQIGNPYHFKCGGL